MRGGADAVPETAGPENSLMALKKSVSEGILYRNAFLYMLVTLFKLGSKKNLRFQIAAQYISAGESVLDVASGGGWLRDYIPASCSYTCIEMGDAFTKSLAKRNVSFMKMNLHQGIDGLKTKFDTAVMIISLYQFRHTSIDQLLEQFKEVANKVVIVEEVSALENNELTIKDKALNYLCKTEYFMPTKILSAHEFRAICEKHGYEVKIDSRKNSYMIATCAGKH